MPVITTEDSAAALIRVTIIEPVRSSPFAWIGATLFAGALLYFLITYAVTFGESVTAPFTWTPIAGNVVLFTLFALHHSVFARIGVRAWVARTVPDDLERSLYVAVASLLFVGVCALWQPVPGTWWRLHGSARAIPYVMFAAGMWLTMRSAALIDVFELAGLRGDPKTQEPRPVFKVHGPYAWVRHPIYSGWFLIVFGVPLMTGTRLVFALVSCAYVLIGLELEERTLRRTSNGAYDDYARTVPYKLIPHVY